MSDDIVTRLKWLGCQYDHSCITCHAIDEIEYLREERNKWEKVAKERNPNLWRNLIRKRFRIENMYER